MMLRRTFVLSLASALVLAGAACGDDPIGPEPLIEETVFDPSLNVDLEAMTKTASGLYWRDVTVGTGNAAGNGEFITVRYKGSLPNGTVFDEVDATEAPFGFILGFGQVIQGWDEGLHGMRVGGRRQLVIPPRLGYGSKGSGSIPGNAILVFTVDLVSAP